MCRRLVGRFAHSRPVEINPKHGPEKWTFTLKLKVKFFRNHPNQRKPTNPIKLLQTNKLKPSNPNELIQTTQPKPTNLNQATRINLTQTSRSKRINPN